MSTIKEVTVLVTKRGEFSYSSRIKSIPDAATALLAAIALLTYVHEVAWENSPDSWVSTELGRVIEAISKLGITTANDEVPV